MVVETAVAVVTDRMASAFVATFKQGQMAYLFVVVAAAELDQMAFVVVRIIAVQYWITIWTAIDTMDQFGTGFD